MNSPLVSVIIPVFNTGASAKFLAEKLSKDSYKNLEILFIDDGSTDDSLKILKTLKNPKIKILSKGNGGVSSARNLGLEKSKGDFLLFIDSDDDVAPEFITKLVETILKKNVALAATGVRYKKLKKGTSEDVYLNPFQKETSESLEEFVLRSLLSDGRMYPTFNKIFRADIVRGSQLRFDESLKFAEDTKFVLDYLKSAKGNIEFILEPLYIYNFGTETSSVKKLNGDWKNWEKSYKNLQSFVGKNSTLRAKVLLRLVRLRWRVSWFRAKRALRKESR